MSDVQDHNGLPEDELIAAEYALGVLAGTERAAAERRIERDQAFANLVEAWEERLAPLAEEIATVAPPPHVWDRIAAALPKQRPQGDGLWQNLVFWRGLTLATGALAASCIGALIYLGTLTQRAPVDRRHRRWRTSPLRGDGGCQTRHYRRCASGIFRRCHPGAGTVADPVRQQTAPARHPAC